MVTCSFCDEKGHAIKTCPKINHKASVRASKVKIEEDHGNTSSTNHWDYDEGLESSDEEKVDEDDDDSSTE